VNLFQYVALTLLSVLIACELVLLWRSPARWGIGVVRCVVWLLAAAAIAFPKLVQDVATAIGIGRGADVVLYLFVLVFLLTSFYFYSRQVRLQRQVTAVVRHLALQEARRGGA
jgi:hypothetical protein